MRTADLCDAHSDTVRVLAPILRDFGKKREFAGPAVTLEVFEDNALVRAKLETPGQGRVLVIDGGGSLRRALVGGNLGKLAENNGWAGVIVHGAVRDTLELAECNVGVKALVTAPLRSEKKGAGREQVPVTFAGVTIEPGHWVYADDDGVIVSDLPIYS
ncbi:Ribonuclease E inhibitor RraA [Labilithrix luteola]|uniref:4-hydroxy-4-methyl-2-oxoglutarate aldolase n=1 Tax=Labilithrix luteola TaxID=1391654 RepID=A0A0K1PNE3_9BACT|nr:ribonuclease E activity regulator RraA [Labilithrix luteola]AKU94629.1 Ribonuclease E inhibitor RraA [Labilithrix luteola]